MELRAYTKNDAETVISWCENEDIFYKWTAGILGDYPITPERLTFGENVKPYIAVDGGEPVGFFILRRPGEADDVLRVGFVINNPELRGKGFGKKMLLLAIKEALSVPGIKEVTLGVFTNNLPAYHCYKAAGFKEIEGAPPETYKLKGEEWTVLEMYLKASVWDCIYRVIKQLIQVNVLRLINCLTSKIITDKENKNNDN